MHAGGIYSIISSRDKRQTQSVMHRALCLCIKVLHIFEKSMICGLNWYLHSSIDCCLVCIDIRSMSS